MTEYNIEDSVEFNESLNKALSFASKSGDDYRRLVHIHDDGENILIDVEGNKGSAHVIHRNVDIIEPGSFILDSSNASRIFKSFRAGEIIITDDKSSIIVEQGRRIIKSDIIDKDSVITPEPESNFPEKKKHLTIMAEDLSSSVNESSHARSMDKIDRVAFTGILLEADKGEMYTFAMSLGATLSPVSECEEKVSFRFLADSEALLNITNILEGELKIASSDNDRKLIIQDDTESVFTINSVNASEDAIKNVSPEIAEKLMGSLSKNIFLSLTVDQKELTRIMSDAFRMSKEDNRIKLVFEEDSITVKALEGIKTVFEDDVDLDTVEEKEDNDIDYVVLSGTVGVNPFKNFRTEENLKISFAEDGRGKPKAVIIGNADSKHYSMVPVSAG